jgi:3',5'-cyclic AMP phosphodiesterase CpdA
MSGGILKGSPLGQAAQAMINAHAVSGGLNFVQISDSHIGFDKAANPDVTATLREAVAKIRTAPVKPSFVLHTGDLTHLSKAAEFDTLQQVLTELSLPVFYVPGEHDVLGDDGKSYLERFGEGTAGDGWYSFDQGGVHFIGLVNVLNLKPGGLGYLGRAQLEWLERDVKRLSSSTPIVVFAHIPLWSVYPEWGWGTEDSAQALSYLKRFGSVSVLNGHIHQVMQKVEGNVTFHTAMSTAFVQPAPGAASSPGPMKVPDDRLRKLLGLSRMSYRDVNHPIAITDVPLDAEDGGRFAGRLRRQLQLRTGEPGRACRDDRDVDES